MPKDEEKEALLGVASPPKPKEESRDGEFSKGSNIVDQQTIQSSPAPAAPVKPADPPPSDE